jgi:cytochrome P450
MAGSDTTAIALRSIIYHLIKTPRVYQKLQDEIDESDQEGLLSPIIKYHESLKLPYLYVRPVSSPI